MALVVHGWISPLELHAVPGSFEAKRNEGTLKKKGLLSKDLKMH